MNSLKSKLIGALIGLARATDGNEHLISDASTAVIISCLTANPETEEDLSVLMSRVEDAKKEMVPDCFLCANPCGRTSAYDLSLIEQEEPDIRNAKYSILAQLQEIAGFKPDKSREAQLYRGLIAIGMDGYSASELHSIFAVQ